MSTENQEDKKESMEDLTFKLSEPIEQVGIVFSGMEANTTTFINAGVEIMKFCENGDIYVKGRLVENDKEVVDGMREFLKFVNK